MKVIKPREFNRLTKEGTLPPTILFTGEEVLLMDRALQRLRDRVLGEDWELNWTVLEGKSATLEQLEEALSTVPFASPRRVVVLKEVLEFWKTWHQRQGERLLRALTRHPSHTLLLLHHPGKLEEEKEKKGPGKALIQALRDTDVLVVNFTGTRRELEEWVRRRLKKEGLPPDQEVIDWLLDISQEKMALLESELEKFILWGKKGERADRPPSLWDVPTMVYRRDPRLLTHLPFLMAEKGPGYLHRMISSSISRLVALHQTAREDTALSRQEAIAKACRHPRERRELARALERIPLAEAMDLLELSMETEMAIKTGLLPPERALEKLIARIIPTGKEKKAWTG